MKEKEAKLDSGTEEGGLFYRLARAVFSLLFLVVFRKKVYGMENIPETGNFIVCSNHINWFDPTLISCTVGKDRQIYFMAKEELFKIPVFKHIITKLGAFPVKRRRADRKAIQHALNLLENNKSVGVFPEGSRSKTGDLQKPYHGPALVVLRSKVPVLPVAIKGPYKLFRPVKINIGKPVYLNSEKKEKGFKRDRIRKVSNTIMEEIKQLADEMQKSTKNNGGR